MPGAISTRLVPFRAIPGTPYVIVAFGSGFLLALDAGSEIFQRIQKALILQWTASPFVMLDDN